MPLNRQARTCASPPRGEGARKSKIHRVPIAVSDGECLDGRGAVVVGKNPGDGVNEGALTIGSGAPQEKQRMFAR